MSLATEAVSGSRSTRRYSRSSDSAPQRSVAFPLTKRIKESRLLVEFREQDSYINSDWESDSSDTAPNLTNSLLTNARILAAAAAQYPRTPGLAPPRLRYILTRLPATGHSDSRIGETITEMQRLGIHVDFCDSQWAIPEPRHIPPLQPAEDIVLDLSIMIALCCDSTHHPLPADEYELESRFRTMKLASSPEGSDGPADNRLVLGNYTNATRDLRDQLRCEIRRPLITEMIHRLNGRTVRFWITREVRDRLPKLVDVIGGERERYRAQAMFNANNFWAGSRWEGKVSENLRDFRVRVLEDEPSWTAEGVSPQHERILSTPFDSAVAHVCREMLSSSEDTPTETPATGFPPDTDGQAMQPRPTGKPKNMRISRNPQRARVGTRFTNSKLPSGHTLRTLLAGIAGGMTILTNNRGAVLKVLREQGVMEGIPFAYAEEGTKEDGQDAHRARIWIVNPSSLAEWRRCQVEKANTELIEQYPGARIERIV